jgi:hypothetical protein
LRYFDLGAGHRQAAGIMNRSVDLRLSPNDAAEGGETQKEQSDLFQNTTPPSSTETSLRDSTSV